MLKKIFLPLLAICALGFTLIHTNPTFAAYVNCDNVHSDASAPRDYANEACLSELTNYSRTERIAEIKEECGTKDNAISKYSWVNNLPEGQRLDKALTAMYNCWSQRGLSNDGSTYDPQKATVRTKKQAQKEDAVYNRIRENADPPKSPDPPQEQEGTDDGSGDPTVQPTSSDLRPGQLPTDESEKPEELKSSCRGALFLGLTSWDCDTNFESIDSEKQLPTLVATIASNILEDITIIATYLIIGYIIYGGYLYIFANGDTGKVATGKKALNQAFIGLAITLSAKIIIETIRIILFNGEGKFSNTEYLKNNLSAGEMVSSIFQWVIGIAGVVSLIFIVGGGIMYMTSEGEPSKLQTAKNTIKYALIGLVIVALAQTITIFMTNIINNANQDSSSAYIINEKEIHEKNILS